MLAKTALKSTAILLLATAGVAFAQDSSETVICQGKGGYTVIFGKDDIAMVKEELGESFEEEVCRISEDLNIEAYETPTAVEVTMSTGKVYNVNVHQNQ